MARGARWPEERQLGSPRSPCRPCRSSHDLGCAPRLVSECTCPSEKYVFIDIRGGVHLGEKEVDESTGHVDTVDLHDRLSTALAPVHVHLQRRRVGEFRKSHLRIVVLFQGAREKARHVDPPIGRLGQQDLVLFAISEGDLHLGFGSLIADPLQLDVALLTVPA